MGLPQRRVLGSNAPRQSGSIPARVPAGDLQVPDNPAASLALQLSLRFLFRAHTTLPVQRYYSSQWLIQLLL